MSDNKERTYKFASYYKYVFTFLSDDGHTVMYGGDKDSIYRAGVEANHYYTEEELLNKFGRVL